MTRADQSGFRRRRPDTGTLPAARLAALCVVAVCAAPIAVAALDAPDAPLSIAVEDVPTVDDPVGESVGETAEDGPVEGEPGAGEAPADLPPEEPAPSESGEDIDAGSSPDGD